MEINKQVAIIQTNFTNMVVLVAKQKTAMQCDLIHLRLKTRSSNLLFTIVYGYIPRSKPKEKGRGDYHYNLFHHNHFLGYSFFFSWDSVLGYWDQIVMYRLLFLVVPEV